MPRYIDADEALLELDKELVSEEFNYAVRAISRVKTADVTEVRRGRWMDGHYFRFIPKKGTQGFQTARCSNCNITQSVNTYQERVQFNYCPYCGADMREEKTDETN